MRPSNRLIHGHQQNGQSGIIMMEILVSIVLTSIAALGIAFSLITSLKVEKLTEIHLVASTMAASRIEELAAVDPLDLDSSYNEANTTVSFPGISFGFSRSTTVTINADNSRTLDVTVSSNSSAVPTTVNFTTTFALWE